MLNRPSEIVEVWTTASKMAQRTGATFSISRERLVQFGFTENQINGILEEIELIKKQRQQQQLRLAQLDTRV